MSWKDYDDQEVLNLPPVTWQIELDPCHRSALYFSARSPYRSHLLTMVCQYLALVWRSLAYELRTFAYELRLFAHGLRTLHACSAPLASALRISAHPLRNVCSAIARLFFLACSKFDGALGARGVCLANLGDSTAYVWRTHSVNEDPWAYWAYLRSICYFFSVRRASTVASPARGTGA